MQRRIWWPHIEITNNLLCPASNSSFVKDYRTRSHHRGLPIVNTQDRVFPETGIQQKSAPVTIFRNVRDTEFLSSAGIGARNVSAFEINRASDMRSGNQPGQRFN